MFIIRIAELNIAINNKYDYVSNMCAEYICSDRNYDFKVSVTDEEILEEQRIGGFDFDPAYLESICLYRSIAKELPKYNAFVMHGAAIEYEGKAYCFTAKSGTGKTTHISLWKELLSDKVSIINGDKPILRLINGKIIAYGTPWCGKEGFGSNTAAPLSGICFIEQAKENSIKKFAHHEALNKLLPQIYLSNDNNKLNATIEIIDLIIKNIPIWHLKCNISIEAAVLSHNTMCGKV